MLLSVSADSVDIHGKIHLDSLNLFLYDISI